MENNKHESEQAIEQEAQRVSEELANNPALPGLGHNNSPEECSDEEDKAKEIGGVAGKRLRAFLERVERLEEEKKGLADDIKEIFAEAKGTGFDVKIMRKILRLRKMEPQKVREEDELTQLYKAAIGMD